MNSQPSLTSRCEIVLKEWRKSLFLSNREKAIFRGELLTLDRQLNRLKKRHLRIGVFGRVGVGKSSLLNALLGKEKFEIDVAHGCTRYTKSVDWDLNFNNLNSVELIDTPGIDEINAEYRARLSKKMALQVDLVLLIIDSDLTRIDLNALNSLLNDGKPVLIVLNRSDQWNNNELVALKNSICSKIPEEAKHMGLFVAAAAPRKPFIQNDGKVRSEREEPKIKHLSQSLIHIINTHGELLLALNSLRRSDLFYRKIKLARLQNKKSLAQELIGKYAAVKASGVAINPILALDFAAGLVSDTALIMQLSQIYDLQMGSYSARELLKKLSLNNALLGGAQVGIQAFLGILKNILIMATPITGGLSLAPAAPVALVQAFLAVQTTKLTGRLAAKVFLIGNKKQGDKPAAMLKRIAKFDPEAKAWLGYWANDKYPDELPERALLP